MNHFVNFKLFTYRCKNCDAYLLPTPDIFHFLSAFKTGVEVIKPNLIENICLNVFD
jgi:hypothetical protein